MTQSQNVMQSNLPPGVSFDAFTDLLVQSVLDYLNISHERSQWDCGSMDTVMIAMCLSASGVPAHVVYRGCAYQNKTLAYGREHLWAVKLDSRGLLSICGGKDWYEILDRIGKGESGRIQAPFEPSDWAWSGPEKIEDRRMVLKKVEEAHENPGVRQVLSTVQRAMLAIGTKSPSAPSSQTPRL